MGRKRDQGGEDGGPSGCNVTCGMQTGSQGADSSRRALRLGVGSSLRAALRCPSAAPALRWQAPRTLIVAAWIVAPWPIVTLLPIIVGIGLDCGLLRATWISTLSCPGGCRGWWASGAWPAELAGQELRRCRQIRTAAAVHQFC